MLPQGSHKTFYVKSCAHLAFALGQVHPTYFHLSSSQMISTMKVIWWTSYTTINRWSVKLYELSFTYIWTCCCQHSRKATTHGFTKAFKIQYQAPKSHHCRISSWTTLGWLRKDSWSRSPPMNSFYQSPHTSTYDLFYSSFASGWKVRSLRPAHTEFARDLYIVCYCCRILSLHQTLELFQILGCCTRELFLAPYPLRLQDASFFELHLNSATSSLTLNPIGKCCWSAQTPLSKIERIISSSTFWDSLSSVHLDISRKTITNILLKWFRSLLRFRFYYWGWKLRLMRDLMCLGRHGILSSSGLQHGNTVKTLRLWCPPPS